LGETIGHACYKDFAPIRGLGTVPKLAEKRMIAKRVSRKERQVAKGGTGRGGFGPKFQIDYHER
jgi:hypothetical protein